MLYAKAMRHAEKHKLDEREVLRMRALAMDLSDVDFLETHKSYFDFRKKHPGIQIILVR